MQNTFSLIYVLNKQKIWELVQSNLLISSMNKLNKNSIVDTTALSSLSFDISPGVKFCKQKLIFYIFFLRCYSCSYLRLFHNKSLDVLAARLFYHSNHIATRLLLEHCCLLCWSIASAFKFRMPFLMNTIDALGNS